MRYDCTNFKNIKLKIFLNFKISRLLYAMRSFAAYRWFSFEVIIVQIFSVFIFNKQNNKQTCNK